MLLQTYTSKLAKQIILEVNDIKYLSNGHH